MYFDTCFTAPVEPAVSTEASRLAGLAESSRLAVFAEALERSGLIGPLDTAELTERLDGVELTEDLELVLAVGAGWAAGGGGADSACEPINQAKGPAVQKELTESLELALA